MDDFKILLHHQIKHSVEYDTEKWRTEYICMMNSKNGIYKKRSRIRFTLFSDQPLAFRVEI